MKIAINFIIALLAFCISPETGAAILVTSVTIHLLAKFFRESANKRKRKIELKRRQEEADAIRAQIAAEKLEREREKEQIRQQQAEEKQRRAQQMQQDRERRERERQRKIAQRQARAQSIIDFYKPYLAELETEKKDIEYKIKMAKKLREVDTENQLTKKLTIIKKRIFDTQLKLEKAGFDLEDAI